MTITDVLPQGMTLRPAAEADEPFLRHVYGTTRSDELAAMSWGEATREAFLDQQFTAQAVDYRRRFPEARFLVVEREGKPIGRLYLADSDDAVHVLDIALLPQHRGHGLGEALLRWVAEGGRRLTLSVARWNPAQRLYLRLGFTVVADDGVYLAMERPAGDC